VKYLQVMISSDLRTQALRLLFAAFPRRVLSALAMSSIDMIPPETAMKRSPFAAGFVIARR